MLVSYTEDVRVVGYVRVSTEEQGRSGLGLADQRKAIRAACAQRGWELVSIIEDNGFSAKNLNRPGIIETLRMVEAGEADALVVSKLDRLSRSVLDFSGLLERSRKKGWSLVALDIGVDTSTANGEVMASIVAVFAQFERRLISERTKAALAIKKAQGVKLGRPVVVTEEVVDRVLAERAEGRTLRTIADGLNADGVRTAHGGSQWWPATVKKLIDGYEVSEQRVG
jgi:DNA invertase Pin-like site-specific DNA recombinase